jgi:arginyl-tRNA--protein-N-Asp/Glu arginylyltransferase
VKRPEPPTRVIWDRPEPCPYLPDRQARLPLRLPTRRITPPEFDQLLELGDRRSGYGVYRATCGSCHECRPIRIPVDEFTPSTSQKRSLKKNEFVTVQVGYATCTPAHLDLYNRHKTGRGLSRSGEPMSESSYRQWMVESCAQTVEMRYFVSSKMIAVSVLDIGEDSVSSVYHYFDPEESRRSLGVYSVLWEIDWCRGRGIKWYYLGYYVRDCDHLNYKANYLPNEIKMDDGWLRTPAR